MPKINKNAQLKHLKQVEKDCKEIETELKQLLKEITVIEKMTREDESKKNLQNCNNRIKQVNKYYSDKIDQLENEIGQMKDRENEYERIFRDYSKKLMKLEDEKRREEIREMNKDIHTWWKERS